jgi:tripartite-type tricarboxylate transporter receptor subunit TctC
MCTSPLAALPHVKGGRLRALAVTGSTRSNAAPGVPTVAEQGVPGFQSTLWYALVAPAATPRPIIDKLHAATVKVLKLPDVIEQLSNQGAQALGLSPQETTKFIQSEIERWTNLIERSGIKAE